MMQSKDFIHSELNSFIKRFSATRVRYEYDALSQVHFVEISPLAVYNSDNDYIRWEEDVYNRFAEAFPSECICFISENSLTEIKNPELVLTGVEYPLPTSFPDAKYGFFTVVNQVNKFENTTFTERTVDDRTEPCDLPNSYIDNIPKAA